MEKETIKILQAESHRDEIGIVFSMKDGGIFCSVDYGGGEMFFRLNFIDELVQKQYEIVEENYNLGVKHGIESPTITQDNK